MNYIAVRGKGNPNEEGGAYRQAIGVLYAVVYILKMSYKSDYKIQGFFEYVVPSLKGLCVQMMHIGAFDDEPKPVTLMDAFLQEKGYVNDFSDMRLHHEIYMSDAGKVPPEKWKTVIRHPIKKAE